MYSISIFGLNNQLDVDIHNIIIFLLRIVSYIRRQSFKDKTENNIPFIAGIKYATYIRYSLHLLQTSFSLYLHNQ